MCDDLNGLDFSFESIPAELLVNSENDILKGFGDSDLDLDCLLNSNLIDEHVDQTSGNPNDDRNAITIIHDQSNSQAVIENISQVKGEPFASLQNQSPVLESLLKCAAMSSPCVNPAPQASNTSFAPTITGRNQSVSETASPVSDGLSNDKEAILAALLRRHEEDRKLLGHLVNDFRRDQVTKESASSPPIQISNSISNKQPRTSSPMMEQTSLPPQVVVTTPVATRPVGIISGTRMLVTTPGVGSASPDLTESMDLADEDYAFDDEPMRPKTKRRSSHNAIEKRYRLSINTRIDELRTLLDGPDSKLSKSAVLRKAIEKVRSLERENSLLRKELNIRNSNARIIHKAVPHDLKREFRFMEESESSPDPTSGSITSPGSSVGGSPPHSPQEQILSGAGAKAPRLAHLLMKHEPAINVHYPTVTPRTRICLAGIFLSLFLFNPMVLWNSSEDAKFVSLGGAVVPGGRTLFSYMQKDTNEHRYTKWLMFSSITIVVMMAIAFMLKMMGKSYKSFNATDENRSDKKTPVAATKVDDVEFLIWRHWKQAEAHIADRAWTRVITELKSVLIVMGQPLPISRWDWYKFSVKNVLFSMGIWNDGITDLKPDTNALGAKSLSKLLSLAYHGYLPLTFSQQLVLTMVLWIKLRSAHLSGEEKCQAWINMSFVHSVVRSRFRRYAADCLQVTSSIDIPARLRWILNPEGYRFLVQYDSSKGLKRHIATTEFDADPGRINLTEGESLVAYAFRRQLLEEALSLLATKDEQRLEEVLSILTLLIEYSSNAQLLVEDSDKGLENDHGMDHAQHWWSNVATVAVLWQQERWDKSRSIHSVVDSPPSVIRLDSELQPKRFTIGNLKSTSSADAKVNELAHAVLLAYRIQRRCIFGPCEVPRPCSHNALKMADKAAHVLENILQSKEEMNKNHWVICIVACHWLLTSRISLSQPPNSSCGSEKESQIQKFERDLSILQAALKRAGVPPDIFRRWSVMHQARLRLWRGSHPVRTALALRKDNLKGEITKGDGNEDEDRSSEISQVREWLHQRLMRPRSGLNGLT